MSTSRPLTVSIPHRLGKQEALNRLKTGLGAARSQYAMLLKVEEEQWTGDRLAFRVNSLGQSANGTIDVAEDHVLLSVHLSGLLGKFAEIVSARVRKQATLMLEKK